MPLVDKYCRTDFASYEEFYEQFSVDMPEGFNFAYDVAGELARTEPNKTALVWCNDLGEEKIISFAEVDRESDRYAGALKSLGIGKGDCVMVILKRHFAYWYFAIAMHKIGAVLIPATHLLTVKDLVYRVSVAGVKMILTLHDDALLDKIEQAQAKTGDTLKIKAVLNGSRAGFLSFDALARTMPDAFARPTGDEAPASRDVMIAYFTSGTTAMPKMVAHDFYYPLCHITTARFWHDLEDGDLHLTVADTGWAKASWGKLYGQWLCGAAVFVYDYDKRFCSSDFLRLIEKYKITSFCAPPTIYRFLIKEDLSRFDLSSLKKASIAGEPLNPEVYYQWLAATGLKLREGYGQTECTVLVATNRWVEPKPGSMGLPMPLTNCAILDAGGRPCEPGEEGEICMPVPDLAHPPLGLFMGYFKDEERTRAVLAGGVYHTGDTAWKDEDGYIWFCGRNDDIIKSSGYRIGPFEVESALIEHPAVLETAVTGVPDPVRGFNVKATIILAKGYEPSEPLKKELQDHVKKVTAPYKYPRIIEFVTELPKTISGKIRRVEIREGDTRREAPDAAGIPQGMPLGRDSFESAPLNETLRTIQSRRSVRSFAPRQVPQPALEAVLRAGQCAPHAGDQRCRLIAIQNVQVLASVNAAAKAQAQRSGLSHLARLGSDLSFHSFYRAPTLLLICAREDAVSPAADCAAAAENMLLAAASLALGACWVYFPLMALEGAHGMSLRGTLRLPEGYGAMCAVALGVPDKAEAIPARPEPAQVTYIR